MPEATHNIHSALTRIRTERGLSARQLHELVAANLPSLSQSRLSRYGLGYAHPTWPEVQGIAAALGVTAESLTAKPPAAFTGAPVPAQPAPPALPAAIKSPAVPPPAAEPSPVVQSVNTPKSFHTPNTPVAPPPPPAPVFPEPPLQPPLRGNLHVDSHRAQLGAELRKAASALAIPKLPPKLWAGWRAYEQTIRRELAALPAY